MNEKEAAAKVTSASMRLPEWNILVGLESTFVKLDAHQKFGIRFFFPKS